MGTNHTDRKRDSLMDRDYPVIIKAILIFFIVSSTINLLSQFFNNMMLDNPTFGFIQLIGGGVSLAAFVLIYKKNINGVYIFALMMFLQVIMNASSGEIFISVIVRLAILSLILFIPSRGVSVYNIMMYRKKHKSDTNNEEPKKEYWENYQNVASISNLGSESVNIEIGGEEAEETNEKEEEIEETSEQEAQIVWLEENNSKDIVEAIEADEGDEKDSSLNDDEKHVKEAAIEEEIEEIEEEVELEEVKDEQVVDIDIDEPIKKRSRIDSKKQHFIKRSLVALVALVLIVGSVVAVKVAKDDYPDYVSSPLDKFKHHYSMANNKLFESLLKQGEEAIANDLNVMGQKFMDDAFEVETNKTDNIIALADYYSQKSEYYLVDSLYRKCIAIDKNNATLHDLLARILWIWGDKEEDMLYHAQMAVNIRPEEGISMLILLNYYVDEGSVDEQKIWAQKYIDVFPKKSYGYLYLAKALYDGGDKEEAKIVYNKAVQLDPDSDSVKKYKYIAGPPLIIENIETTDTAKKGTNINDTEQKSFTKNYRSEKGNFTFAYPSYLSAQKIENAPHMLLKLDSDNHAFTFTMRDYNYDSSASVWDDEIVSFYKQSDANYPNAKIITSCDKVNLTIANNKKAKCLKSELEASNTVQGYTLKQKITVYRFAHKGNYLQFMFFVMDYHDYWNKSPFTDEIMKGLTLD